MVTISLYVSVFLCRNKFLCRVQCLRCLDAYIASSVWKTTFMENQENFWLLTMGFFCRSRVSLWVEPRTTWFQIILQTLRTSCCMWGISVRQFAGVCAHNTAINSSSELRITYAGATYKLYRAGDIERPKILVWSQCWHWFHKMCDYGNGGTSMCVYFCMRRVCESREIHMHI